MFNELTSNAHFVALAAAGAVIATGWRQIKSAMSYLSSFLVVTYKMDSRFNYSLTKYLRSQWSVIPNGKFWIVSSRERHQRMKIQVVVPYTLPSTPTIYRRGWKFLVFTTSATNQTQITTFRWINVQEIVRESCQREVEEDLALNREATYKSRFSVYDIVGRDKSDNRLAGGGGSVTEPEPGASKGDLTGDSQVPWIFPDVDTSFMYSADEYTDPPKKEGDGSEFLSKDTSELLSETAKWYDKREWFQERMIPWRRGILLYGPGGTGKSTLAVILARRLMIPIYRFHLNTLSDKEFLDRMSSTVSSPCVVLFEDFDRVFKGRDSVKNNYLSFDTVINAMSGVKTVEGVIFVITTNDITSIDPSIGVQVEGTQMSSRPGRIDRILYMGEMPTEQRHLLIDKILGDWTDLAEQAKLSTEGFTIVQTQEFCVQLALEKIH